MLKKYIKFYSISLVLIFVLISLFWTKMQSTYEAKHNFLIFKEISSEFSQKNITSFENLKLINKNNIDIQTNDKILTISIINNDYRTCLKYGVEYMSSDFTSILINTNLFTRKDIITRDIILDKCNKTFNNITLTQKMEKK